MVRGSDLTEAAALVAEIPALAHLPKGLDVTLRAHLSWPVIQRYARAMNVLFEFSDTHWPERPVLPVQAPALLIFLQHTFNEYETVSRVDSTIRAVNWFHKVNGLPEVVSATIAAARLGFAKISASRTTHTAVATTEQVAALIEFCLAQKTFVHFRLAVALSVMATSGLRRINVASLAKFDLFFFHDRLVLFVATCKNRILRHGSFRTIARNPSGAWCAVRLLELYLSRTGIAAASSEVAMACPIFRASRGSKAGTVLAPAEWGAKPIATSTLNALFRKVADGLGFKQLTFHSMRVWMATELMAKKGVVLTKTHGDWRSDSVLTYVNKPSEALLAPPAVLTAALAAEITGGLPPTAVTAPVALPETAPVFPDPARPVADDEALVSW